MLIQAKGPLCKYRYWSQGSNQINLPWEVYPPGTVWKTLMILQNTRPCEHGLDRLGRARTSHPYMKNAQARSISNVSKIPFTFALVHIPGAYAWNHPCLRRCGYSRITICCYQGSLWRDEMASYITRLWSPFFDAWSLLSLTTHFSFIGWSSACGSHVPSM